MLSILIPVKNEPDLNPLLFRIHEVVECIPDQYEVLIIQGDKERGFYPYVHLPHQRTVWTYADSLERSILNGFSSSKGDRIIVLDADGSHPLEKIPELYRALDKYDMAVGSRFIEGAEFKSSALRQLVTSGCKYLAWFAGSALSDPMSGFFAIRREILDNIRFKPLTWKVCLEIELKAQPSIVEVPIHFVERSVGISKTTLGVGMKILLELAFIGVTGML
jgi:dolichol-phosphate mannosyltransferase